MTITAASSYDPTAAIIPADAILLKIGDDYQAIVDAAPDGATFFFESGVHRLSTPIDPKENQTFIGDQSAVLDGSHVITQFDEENGYFVASGQTQQGFRHATEEGAEGAERPGFPETFFIDGKPLRPAESLDGVEPGKFYFNYDSDKIYFADDPAGRTVEAGVSSAAFHSDSSGVTIKNLTIEQFNAPTQHGAIQGGANWTIEDNEVRLNYGVGITARDGSTIIGNNVHNNGQMGIGGSGDGILVQGNEIHANGFWSGIDQLWEGGGTKFAKTHDLVVRDNYSHDNNGFGLWTDIDNMNTLYEGNLVVDNAMGGINHEISYDAVIRDNVLVGNGSEAPGWLWGSAIQLQNSQNVEVYGNKIDMSGGNGIGLIQQDRGVGEYGEYTTTNNHVHSNILVATEGGGITGGAADHDEEGLLNGGNVFSQNTYHMDGGDHWWWGDFESGDSWQAYQSDTDQDEGSTLSSDIPDTAGWIDEMLIPLRAPDLAAPEPGLKEIERTPDPEPDLSVPDQRPGASDPDGKDARLGTAGDDVISGGADSEQIEALGGNDVIFTGKGADVLNGGTGFDLLFGGEGPDQFVFSNGSGRDSVEDFTLHGLDQDVLVFMSHIFETFSDVMASAEDIGADTVIAWEGNELWLSDMNKAELSYDDFLFN